MPLRSTAQIAHYRAAAETFQATHRGRDVVSIPSSAPSSAFDDRSAFVEVAEEDVSCHGAAFDAGFSRVSVTAADVDLVTDLGDDGVAVEDGGGGGVEVDPVGVALEQQWHPAGGVRCFDPQAAGDGVGTENAHSLRLVPHAVRRTWTDSSAVNRRLSSTDVRAATRGQQQRYEEQRHAGSQLHGDQTQEQPRRLRDQDVYRRHRTTVAPALFTAGVCDGNDAPQVVKATS